MDESPERFDVIEGLLTVNLENITVFLCVRTTLYELGEARYENNLPEDYLPLDINELPDTDISSFVQVLNKLGLWGGKAALADDEKENFVKTSCRK